MKEIFDITQLGSSGKVFIKYHPITIHDFEVCIEDYKRSVDYLKVSTDYSKMDTSNKFHKRVFRLVPKFDYQAFLDVIGDKHLFHLRFGFKGDEIPVTVQSAVIHGERYKDLEQLEKKSNEVWDELMSSCPDVVSVLSLIYGKIKEANDSLAERIEKFNKEAG